MPNITNAPADLATVTTISTHAKNAKEKPMSAMTETRTIRIDLDKAFRYAVTLAWEDLRKVSEPRSVRVEYMCEPGTALDHLCVWLIKERRYEDLVCDYWTWTSSVHASGASFRNAQTSEKLAQALGFITENQELFSRSKDSGSHGLVLIHPPASNDLTEAATWMTAVKAFQSALAPQPPNDHRSIDLDWSKNAHPSERAATLADATGYSGWE
jgi:hypothetical protein